MTKKEKRDRIKAREQKRMARKCDPRQLSGGTARLPGTLKDEARPVLADERAKGIGFLSRKPGNVSKSDKAL